MTIDFSGEKEIHIDAEQSILEASLRAGIPHFHACGGQAKCSTCRVMVLEGAQNLSTPNQIEVKLRDEVKLPCSVRLACQTKVISGNVRVERLVRDQEQVEEIVELDEDVPGAVLIKPIGEEKELVMLFIDIRNFTIFVETYLPFDVIYIVRKLLTLFAQAVTKFGGEIIETAGDELFVVFNDDDLLEPAESAIAAGHTILEMLDEFNIKYGQLYKTPFEVGIGVHADKVIVGNIVLPGISKKSVMGLGVNATARLQGITKVLNNSFIVSDEVMEQLTIRPKTESHSVFLKGISRPYKVHFLGKPYSSVTIN
ncbi:MAG: adenylate/guanylate cyclase domain-containing protein [Cyclobacteriaceae bacterium]|nr:adenylate/guanylate cyclase domain-containing protein [Cyclobacteriaceae bacterium]